MTEKEAAKELSDELRVITDILEYCKYFEKESDLALAYRIKRQESMKMATKPSKKYSSTGRSEPWKSAGRLARSRSRRK